MKKKLILALILIVVVIGAVLAVTVFKKSNGNGIVYKKEKIDRGNIQALVITTGTLNPVTLVDVGSQVSGKIEQINVDFNSHVKKGEIIARIEQLIFLTKVQQNEANYDSAKASVDKAEVMLEINRKNFERSLSLAEKDLISFEEKEKSEADYSNGKAELQSQIARLAQAKSQLDTSKVDLGYTVIRSPIDGFVVNRNINEGQTVAASFNAPLLFQIANDLTKMQVECSVDEADIGKVSEGQAVQFTVDAFPNDRFRGEVRQVRYSPVIEQNVVTYTTIVGVDNPDMKLRPGMTATVNIITGEARNALRVPNSALRYLPDLSQEELRAMMQERFGGSRPGGQGSAPREGSQAPSQPPSDFQRGQSGQRQGGMRDMSRVWIEDENGKLKMVFIKTGVTDNTFSEIVSGDITEGTEIITGIDTSSGNNRNSRNNPARGMMQFMR
ncbi:MAG: efflux RND transporter periplasmic adaptor subunit [Acidobacteria bacterium]|nr:efflux RND transporter periplasmic adaptor subunit [Acidobacteriota bacterium]MBU4254449.1 efflux RND transporter periplasmic adaptor subunit [Acidobacteriota bacterium]MBU4495233.1 efflux RND transporter periplasmic adaptor subunit [Acidobacteriota bacterium]